MTIYHEINEQIHGRVLQNTLEQLVVSFLSQLSASTWLEPRQMNAIPIVVTLFVVGRLLFWRGYLNPGMNHTNRASGLPLSIWVSFLLILFSLYKLIVDCLGWV